MDRVARRMAREEKTLRAMVSIYCRGNHGPGPCAECASLLEYARGRLGSCPFRKAKPTCADCAVHCYRPDMRGRIRAVMRYAGPRMALRHPVLSFLHILDSRKPAPSRPS
jgi:hypothetical protein